MKHCDEQLLERFLLDSNRLDDTVRRDIQSHLEACPVCAGTLEFLRSFYEEYRSTRDVTSKGIDRLMPLLFPSDNIIPLHPFHYTPGPRQDDRYTTVLAAMTNEKGGQRFHTVATLTSESQGTVVRMVYDRSEESFKLYVHSDDPQKREYAIISVPEIGTDFVTDKKGQVTFRTADKSLQLGPGSLSGVLLTVVTTLSVAATDFKQAQPSDELAVTQTDGKHSVRLTYNNGLLNVAVQSQDNHLPITRLLVQPSEDRALLVALKDGAGGCNLDDLPPRLTLRLYY